MLNEATISAKPVSAGGRAQSDSSLIATWSGRGVVLASLALAMMSAVFAVLHAFRFFDHARYYGLIQVGMIALALVQLGGFSTMRQRPLLGAAQVLVPGLALAALWSFLFPVAIGVLVLTAYGVYEAYRYGQARRRTAPA